jgi:glycosyltransferase involved in cell wall biosynthesis
MTRRRSVAAVVTYHDEKPEYLVEAIESALAQTLPPVEILVIDDGSTPPAENVVRSLGRDVRYLYQTSSGLGAARSAGVAATTAESVAFLDADDVWPADRLERLQAALPPSPELAVAVGSVVQFLSPDLDDHAKQRFKFSPEPMPGLLATTMLIPREVFVRIGPFSRDRQIHQTVEWIGRLQEERIPIVAIPDVVLRRRIHLGNFGVRQRGERGDYARALKVVLDRRRGRDAG